MKVCILSENSNGTAPHLHYRNLGASEVGRKLASKNIPYSIFEWFTHWDVSDLKECVLHFLKGTTRPVIAISVPFTVKDVYSIKDMLFDLKHEIANLEIIIGGNRVYDSNLADVIDHFFIGRSMEIFDAWLDGRSLDKYKTVEPKVYLNKTVNAHNEIPVISSYNDSDFITKHDVLGFELGIGCRFNCTFCNYDLRNMRNPLIVDPVETAGKLQSLYDRYGVTNFFITDDTINESVEKLQALSTILDLLTFKPNLAGYFRLDLLESEEQQKYWQKIDMAGVFFGIETFNPEASKGVRKSSRMLFQIETLKKLRTLTPNTFLTAGMIIGLTGDSEEHIFKSLENVAEQNLLDSMLYSPLGLTTMNSSVFDDFMLSDLVKDPERFGYKLTGEIIPRSDHSVQDALVWKNEWCDYHRAVDLYTEVALRQEELRIGIADAFDLLPALSLGIIEHKQEFVLNTRRVKELCKKKSKILKHNYFKQKKQYILSL